MTTENAIIMAAGTSARFVPNSFEYPKGLTKIKDEILIERQIKQLKEADVKRIVVVTGYMADSFDYLRNFGVILVHNPDFDNRNNHSSLYYAQEYLEDCFICSADNYYRINPFQDKSSESYYSSVYAFNETNEWIIQVDENDKIVGVSIGGKNDWIMLGHAYFNTKFGKKFREILNKSFSYQTTVDKYWEDLLVEHLDDLTIFIRRYPAEIIFEFDSLDELREFDCSFWMNPQSEILNRIAIELGCFPNELSRFIPVKENNTAIGFSFIKGEKKYYYFREGNKLLNEDTIQDYFRK